MAVNILATGSQATFECDVCEQVRHVADLALCSWCGNDKKPVYFCIRHCSREECNHRLDCTLPQHLSCFDSEDHIISEKKRSRHEKRNALDAWCIEQIMYCAVDEATQLGHHRRDYGALWFRVNQAVSRPRGPEPCLQVSKRFEKLWQSSHGQNEQKFPSFVSFVGGTGVGKSTLVRAMMMIGALQDMRQSTDSGRSSHGLHINGLMECRARGPVTKAKHATLGTRPTSDGVHLYQDSAIQRVHYSTEGRNSENMIILLADCEGFNADTTISSASRVNGSLNLSLPRRARSRHGSNWSDTATTVTATTGARATTQDQFESDEIRANLRFDKSIPILASRLRKRGKEGAELFYARYLYAFSDVVLFVTDKWQSLGSELRKFLERIAQAEARALPPRSPRTLVIVINKGDSFAKEHYDESFLMDNMFMDLANQRIWESSDELAILKAQHDSGPKPMADRINDNMSFFHLFFKEVRICCIPKRGEDTDEMIYQQYLALRNMILKGSEKSQKARSEDFSRYNVPTVAHLLDKAFDHYANSDEPFNFHAAARKDNPTPISLSGHIASLLRHTGTDPEHFDKIADLLAICLLTYEYRESMQAREPTRIFHDELLFRCQRGFDIYGKKFQLCGWAYQGSKCVSVYTNHADQHQKEDGTRVPGPFDQSLFSTDHRRKLTEKVYQSFLAMYQEAYTNTQKPLLDDMRRYRSKVLGFTRDPLQPLSDLQPSLQFTIPSDFLVHAKSNKTCFACLQAPPDHFLPCGHGYCPDCIKDFGKVFEDVPYRYRLESCVLCAPNNGERHPEHIVRLDPRAAGVRLLTLDGGGIRGILELELLSKLEEKINLDLPISELFDLICGTSTGGIIALGVGSLTKEVLSMDSLKEMFMRLAQETFEKDRLSLNNLEAIKLRRLAAKVGYGLIFLGLLSSRYSSAPRRNALLEAFHSSHPLFGPSMTLGTTVERPTRVAVYACSSGTLCTFANYSRDICEPDQATDRNDLGADQGFVREDDPSREPKIWEAAMATSAAPGYFVRWRIDDPIIPKAQQKAFADGALRANMPLNEALQEKDMIWSPAKGPKKLDLSVSVGSGYSDSKLSVPSWLDRADIQEVVKAYHESVLNSEELWNYFKNNPNKYRPSFHFRLNLHLPKNIDLDDWKAMEDLSLLAKHQLPNALQEEIDTIAYQLVACLLYFEPQKRVPPTPTQSEFISGYIWCRLPTSSGSAHRLFSRIEGFYHQESPRLAIHRVDTFQESFSTYSTMFRRRRTWEEIRQNLFSVPEHTMSRPEHERKHFEIPYAIECTEDRAAEQCIYVNLLDPGQGKKQRRCRISGFPMSYNDMLEILEKRRGVQ